MGFLKKCQPIYWAVIIIIIINIIIIIFIIIIIIQAVCNYGRDSFESWGRK